MKGKQGSWPLIAIVGHLVKDEIISSEGKMHLALGGTAYSLAALCALVEEGRIHPVCRVGHDIEKLIEDAFESSPGFDNSGIIYHNRPTIVHRLRYCDDGSREEWNSGKPGPLAIDDIPIKSDVVMLNFISGNDIRLGDLKTLRKRYRRLIYCDYHSLALGRDKFHNRYHRYHPRWKEYLSSADIVQMNLAELSSIFRKPTIDICEIASAMLALHNVGPRIVIITMGDRGVMISQRNGNVYHVPALKLSGKVDPTGCGDTLGAAFVWQYLQHGDIVKAIEVASRFAAAKATFTGLDGFNAINEIAQRVGPAARAREVGRI